MTPPQMLEVVLVVEAFIEVHHFDLNLIHLCWQLVRCMPWTKKKPKQTNVNFLTPNSDSYATHLYFTSHPS